MPFVKREPTLYTDAFGRLTDAGLREMARLARLDLPISDVAALVGTSRSTAAHRLRAIRRALGLPNARVRWAAGRAEILRRAQAGQSDQDIAVKLGRTLDAVQKARRTEGLHYARHLALSPQEEDEVRRRLMAGESTRAIAAATGIEAMNIKRRRQRIAHLIPGDLPPCACGKARGHGGKCRLSADQLAIVRQRLLDGVVTHRIAQEFGLTSPNFRKAYAQPIIDQLTAEGHRCGCGRPLGHSTPCAFSHPSKRPLTEEQIAQARAVLTAGGTAAALAEAIAINRPRAAVLMRKLRGEMAAQGARCPCGRPLDHHLTCVTRQAKQRGRVVRRYLWSATALAMPARTRRTACELVGRGLPLRTIRERTGLSDWKLDQVVRDLEASAFVFPTSCATCGKPWRHRSPCLPIGDCRCGRPRWHRGACRTLPPVSQSAHPLLRQSDDPATAALHRDIKRMVHNGASMKRIARKLGVSFATVQRFVTKWRANARHSLRPCACGKPALHPGGCVRNTPGALGKRWRDRIYAMTMEGMAPHRIAEALDISIYTAAAHSLPARAERAARGDTCSCGRPFGHPFWCTAKWDDYEMPRGSIPLAQVVVQRIEKRLIAGDQVDRIAKAEACGADRIYAVRADLSPADRERRRVAVCARLRRKYATQVDGDRLMASIRTAVPQHINGPLRDDVVNELFLAVLEGRVEAAQIQAVVRSFVSRGIAEWQSDFGPKSLDAPIDADGGRTLADLISDGTALAEIDEIEIGSGHLSFATDGTGLGI